MISNISGIYRENLLINPEYFDHSHMSERKISERENMRINEPNWYPCYINPDYDELAELAESHWDTVRILIVDEPRRPEVHNAVVLASGYGNTHETLARALRRQFKRKLFTYDFILYKKGGKALFNDIASGHERVSVEEMMRSFTKEQQRIFSDLLALSELQYDS